MRSQERDHERHRINQRFLNMDRQIGGLTGMLRALTEKIFNGREKNVQNVRDIETSLCSDMVTGVSTNPLSTPNTQQPRRTSIFFTNHKWMTA